MESMRMAGLALSVRAMATICLGIDPAVLLCKSRAFMRLALHGMKRLEVT